MKTIEERVREAAKYKSDEEIQILFVRFQVELGRLIKRRGYCYFSEIISVSLTKRASPATIIMMGDAFADLETDCKEFASAIAEEAAINRMVELSVAVPIIPQPQPSRVLDITNLDSR